MRFGNENPVFRSGDYSRNSDYGATYLGVTTKITILLGIIAVVAMYTANNFVAVSISNYIFTILGASIFGIISVFVTHRFPQVGFIFAPAYALCEGVVLGTISAIYAYAYGGEIIEVALLSTFGVFGAMLFLYATGIIRVGSFFRRLMYSVLGGLLVVSLVFIVLSLTGIGIEAFYTFYVAIVVISVIAASLFLLIDFDRITRYVESGAGRESEWSLGLGLVTTLVWLYIEILRLVAIFTRD